MTWEIRQGDCLEEWIDRGWLERVAPPELPPEPTGQSVVLDPFAGAGTTLKVAVERGRSAIGIELNPDYCVLAERRLAGVTPPLFA